MCACTVLSYIPLAGQWERAGEVLWTGDPNFWSFHLLQKGSQESYSGRINNSRIFLD